MCAPMIGLAVGIAQSVASFSAQQADYQAKSAAWTQNVINSQAAARDEQRQLQIRGMQEQEATAQKVKENSLEMAEKRSAAEVAAISAGSSGLSLDNLLADLSAQGFRNKTVLETNQKMKVAQLTEELKGSVTKMQNRINSMERPTAPSPLGLIAGIAGAGAKYAGSTA